MASNVLHEDGSAKDLRVEKLVQTLEETCERLKSDESISVMRRDPASAAYVPMRIRELVQEYLSPQDKVVVGSSLHDENAGLQRELERAQELLQRSQNDCQDLSTKYISVSEKIEQVLSLESQVADLQLRNRQLQGENQQLRLQLRQQEDTLSLQLQEYQDSQDLVKKLQDESVQYKGRCIDLEATLRSQEGVCEEGRGELVVTIRELEERVVELQREHQEEREGHHEELKSAIESMEEHQERTVKLVMNNNQLCQQLEEAQSTSNRLMEDVHQLTARWNKSQLTLREKEAHWQESFEHEYDRSLRTHQLSLTLTLKDASAMRSEVAHLKTAIQRELGVVQEELGLLSQRVRVRVVEEAAQQRAVQEKVVVDLRQKGQECAKLTAELAALSLEHEALQTHRELVTADHEQQLHKASSALREAEHICQERSKVIDHLEASNADLESERNNLMNKLEEAKASLSSLQEESSVLKAALDTIIQVFTIPGYRLSGSQPLKDLSPESKEGKPVPAQLHFASGRGAGTVPGVVTPQKARHTESQQSTGDHSPTEFAGDIKSQWLNSPPKVFGTPGDVTRLRDWAVSVVRHGVDARDETIQALQAELSSLRDDSQRQECRLREMEGEVRAHTTTSEVVKNDLEGCQDSIRELTRVRTELEQQLENANTQKYESERQVSQTMARVDTLLQEKTKMEESNSSLEEAMHSLRCELEQVKQAKEAHELELTNTSTSTKKLEMQLRSAKEEAEGLHVRISELESVKLGLEKDMSQHNLAVATLEAEKESLQRELKAMRESEASTVDALSQLRAANQELEMETHQLNRSLTEATETKSKLDQDNAELQRLKIANEEELHRLKSANVHLTEQVGQLDKRIGQSEMTKMEAQNERDQLKQEVSALSEALGKSKQALEEVQTQRGKLNNAIAKVAQEKGDLVREKVSLSGKVTQLQESLHASKERLASLQVVKERLEQKVQELEKRVALAELNQTSLEEANLALQEKHDLSVEKGRTGPTKEAELRNEKGFEFQRVIVRAKSTESITDSTLECEAVEQKLREAKEVHENEIANLTERHSEIVHQLREEIELLSKAHRTETARFAHEKQFAVSQIEDEKGFLVERISKLERLLDERCAESRSQHQHSIHLAAEQKAELEASQLNAGRLAAELEASQLNTERLAAELAAAGQQLQALQGKLDRVRTESGEQVESLQVQLREASHTITRLEQSHSDIQMTVRQLEAEGEGLRIQCGETHRQLENALKEKEALRVESQELRRNLDVVLRDLAEARDSVSSLEERLTKAEEGQSLSQIEASNSNQTLTRVEQLHTKLVSEHATLQATLTGLEKKKTSLQHELKSALDKVSLLEKQNEDLGHSLKSVENRLKVATKSCELREQEVSNYKERASGLQKERNELGLNLQKLQKSCHLQGEVDAARLAELQSEVAELRVTNTSLQDKASFLETALEGSQQRCSDLGSKLVVAGEQVTSLTSRFNRTDNLCKDIQVKYTQLVSILEGTLGLTPAEENEESGISICTPDSSSHTATNTKKKPSKDQSLDSSGHLSRSLAESGVGVSLASPCTSKQSSLGGADIPGHPTSPSDVVQINVGYVRDAILQLQKRLIAAEQSTVSSAKTLHKKIQQTEEEKASLEARLNSLRSSLTSLQTSFDSMSTQRDSAEVTVKLQKDAIRGLEKHERELRDEVQQLKLQLKGERTVKQLASDTELKKYAESQIDYEIERGRLKTHVQDLESHEKQLEEEIGNLRSEADHLQSTCRTMEAEISQLQQKLETSQHLRKEAEEQLRSLKVSMKSLDQSSRDSEKQFLDKTQQLEMQLAKFEGEKLNQERKITDLQHLCDSVQREKGLLVERLRLLPQNRPQRKQTPELDQASSKQNIELMRSVRELRAKLVEKEKEHEQALKGMAQKMDQLQGAQKLRDAKWVGKEQTYKKKIQQLEAKIHLLESKLQDSRRKKSEYIERAKEHEEAIQGLRYVLEGSVHHFASDGLESPTAIDYETSKLNESALNLLQQRGSASKMPVRSHYSPSTSAISPTHLFPSPDGPVSPHSASPHPLPRTSTPAKRGYNQQLTTQT